MTEKNEKKKKQSCQISQNLRLPPSKLVVEQTDEPTYLIKVQKVWAFFVKIEQVETSLNKSTIVKDDKSFPIHPPDQSYNGLKSNLKEHPIFNTTIKIRIQLQKSFHPIVNWFDTMKFDVPMLKFRIKIRDITPFRA